MAVRAKGYFPEAPLYCMVLYAFKNYNVMMLKWIQSLCFLFFSFLLAGQDLYFPPLSGNEWDTLSIDEMGYCQDSVNSLFDYLEDTETKAFLLLKDGKIVVEEYFDSFTQDSFWYWASAGKTLTATLTGIAQQEGILSIWDTTSQYLGEGWTSLDPEMEKNILIYHQLSMTSGLDDSRDGFCTEPQCLTYLAEPGTRWAYHNAPYTLLSSVIEEASGLNYNTFTRRKLLDPTGMDGLWLPVGYNRIFFSTPRSMARFGLLMLNHGYWDQIPVLLDTNYYQQMTNPSQDLNNSYGYLWWLNGYDDFMLPGSQVVFDGPLVPAAPSDAIFGLGANGQMLAVVPSENIVAIRMGNEPGNELVSVNYIRELWERISRLSCSPSSVGQQTFHDWQIYPQPASKRVYIEGIPDIQSIEIFDLVGHKVLEGSISGQNYLGISSLLPGCYVLVVYRSDGQKLTKILVKSD